MSETEEIMQFPCRFPIKIMGERHEDFVSIISELVRLHATDLTEDDILLRESSAGRFYALTITVTATSRQQLDNIYMALSQHPMVKMAL